MAPPSSSPAVRSETAEGALTELRDAVGDAVRRGEAAAGNVRDYLRQGHLADIRRMPRTATLHGAGWTLHRYAPLPGVPARDLRPVLLVPPLGAPDFAFDLRRGASLVEYLLAEGRPVYVVTYENTARGGRRGLELWVDRIVPTALDAVAAEHPSPEHPSPEHPSPVHLAGWSLGGLFVLLTAAGAAAAGGTGIASVTAFASPVDVAAVPLVAPFRSVAEYTGGALFTAAYRTLGSFPATLVKWAFQLSSVERYVTKPVTVLTHLDDRPLLEQIEAVDELMDSMTAYPGRAFGQIYHRMIRNNDLARDELVLAGRAVRLADVTAPVLLVAGSDDVIAPVPAVHRAAELLTASSDLRFTVEPGGHLGVLAGRRARTHSWRAFTDFLADHDA